MFRSCVNCDTTRTHVRIDANRIAAPRVLRTRRIWPRGRRTAEQRDELATLHCPSRASDRKPNGRRLLHPSHVRSERDEHNHAAENFFQGGSPKIGHPLPRQQPPSPPKMVLSQISEDDVWMKI